MKVPEIKTKRKAPSMLALLDGPEPEPQQHVKVEEKMGISAATELGEGNCLATLEATFKDLDELTKDLQAFRSEQCSHKQVVLRSNFRKVTLDYLEAVNPFLEIRSVNLSLESSTFLRIFI